MNAQREAMIRRQVHRGAPTYTGRFVNPNDLKTTDIDIRDIAHHLSLANRYMGATEEPYSVAQHSYYCWRLAPESVKWEALMHDSGEAYFGDLSRVIKYMDGYAGEFYRAAEARAARVIEKALGFEPHAFEDPEVKRIDDLVGDMEWDALIEGQGSALIYPWPAKMAERRFLDAAGFGATL